MKYTLTILYIAAVMLVAGQNAPPLAFDYSGIARNANNNALTNHAIGVQISIIKSVPTGATVYQENHSSFTDGTGLFHLVIGAGAVQYGTFSTIDWGDDKYYLKVGIDTAAGTNFATSSTTEMLSVPYALYAKNAGSINGASQAPHYVGQLWGGGVVFYVENDSAGNQHGLIIALTDQGDTSVLWSHDTTLHTGAASQWDGKSNTDSIIAAGGLPGEAAGVCRNYNGGGYNDWFLGASYQLTTLYNTVAIVNKVLVGTLGAAIINPANYRNSTEYSNKYAGGNNFYFLSGVVSQTAKNWKGGSEFYQKYYVRAIRAF